jgi:hypothetical protein
VEDVPVLTVPLFCAGMEEIPYRKLVDGLLFHRIKFRPIQFTLADVSWMVIFERLAEADWLDALVGPNHRPQLYAYWSRLQQRPGYAGISEYRLPVVDRATDRIRAYKKIHPELAGTLTGYVA